MRNWIFINIKVVAFAFGLFIILFNTACKKEKVPVPTEPEVQEWEKFVGSYKVYDTLGIYLFDASISHFSGINQYGVMVDSIIIKKFADTMDLKFQFIEDTYNKAILNIGFSQPTYDKLNNPWNITTNMQDTLTPVLENNLVNDTMILYFRLTNITYYDNISTFYYWCDCKHVYVKQK